MASSGKYILFADADGAPKFSDLDSLLKELDRVTEDKNGFGLAIGSRAHMIQSDSIVKVLYSPHPF